MPYTVGLNMGLADRAILNAVQELQSERDFFGYEEIAEAVPCGIVTVARTMPKLIDQKKIRRIGAKKNRSIRYEVCK